MRCPSGIYHDLPPSTPNNHRSVDYNTLKIMLSIEACNKILNKNEERKYTTAEVKEIREYLYQIARLEINNNLNEEENESNTILSSVDR